MAQCEVQGGLSEGGYDRCPSITGPKFPPSTMRIDDTNHLTGEHQTSFTMNPPPSWRFAPRRYLSRCPIFRSTSI